MNQKQNNEETVDSISGNKEVKEILIPEKIKKISSNIELTINQCKF